MVTDSNDAYHGEHSIVYRIVKSPSCTPETNTTLYVNYTSRTTININTNTNIYEHTYNTKVKIHLIILPFPKHKYSVIYKNIFSSGKVFSIFLLPHAYKDSFALWFDPECKFCQWHKTSILLY